MKEHFQILLLLAVGAWLLMQVIVNVVWWLHAAT
jgi:hypothetical protein